VPSFFQNQFYGIFLRLSAKGQCRNTIKNFLGKYHVKNFLQKAERKNKSCIFPPSIFVIAFLTASLHEELQNTTIFFPKTQLQNNPKKIGR
jgi:hypothetical protein